MSMMEQLSNLYAALKDVDIRIAAKQRENKASGMGASCFDKEEMRELFAKRKSILRNVSVIMHNGTF